MHQQTLPLWVSDRHITYSELRKRCIARYAKESPNLISQAEQSLVAFEDATTHTEAIHALHGLNDLVMELSVLNPIWENLSTLIFEHTMLVCNATNLRAKRAIRSLFNATLKEQHEHTNRKQ